MAIWLSIAFQKKVYGAKCHCEERSDEAISRNNST